MNLIHTLSQKIGSITTSLEGTSDHKLVVESRSEFVDMKYDYVMPRKDIYIVLVALSSRILHMLLLLDPIYKNWTIISAKGSSSSFKMFRSSLFDVSAYPDAVSDINLSTANSSTTCKVDVYAITSDFTKVATFLPNLITLAMSH